MDVKFKYWLRLAGEVVYPRKCGACSSVIDDGCFCPVCRRNFTLSKRTANFYSDDGALDEAIFLYKYRDHLQDFLHNIKFNDDAALLPLLAEEAQMALPVSLRHFTSKFDVVSYIPTSPERRQRRGFEIPREIFACLHGAKWHDDLLIRTRRTQPLFGLEPNLRRDELVNCFKLNSDVQDRRVLLCDDIFTTGSTMQEAARLLKSAGAARVTALTFAASRDNW